MPPEGASEFEEAFDHERRRLFGIAYSILRHPYEAEDAVQEVAIQAWKGWHQRQDEERTGAWLATICVRHCMRRRQGLWRRLLETSTDRSNIAAAFDHLRYDGRYLDLDRAYASLSRQQRAIVTLHYQQGFTVPECAEMMACSTGAAASHLSRALAKLRIELTEK